MTCVTPSDSRARSSACCFAAALGAVPSSSTSPLLAVTATLAPFRFDTIYGHYFDRVIPTGAKHILKVSVDRYLAAIAGTARAEGE